MESSPGAVTLSIYAKPSRSVEFLNAILHSRSFMYDTRQEMLAEPYGGELKDLLVDPAEADDLRAYANSLPAVSLSERALCDLELIATGAFSPLDRFMSQSDYRSVLETMRLGSGHIFPIPVTLAVDRDQGIKEGSDVVLRDATHKPLAVMSVEEIYEWDRPEFAREILKTESTRHPLVTEIAAWKSLFISGPVRVVELPRHYDFPDLRLSPAAVRERLTALGNPNVVAFQTRNPLHRAHEEMTKRAIEETDGVLLMHPVVGSTKAGDVNHFVRVLSYKALVEKYYDPNRVLLALLPLAMRFAGPREALWHAIVRRNYGANHFIIGRDHASPGSDEHGRPFYEANAARDLVESFSEELGVKVVPFEEMVYLPETEEYRERSKVPDDTRFFSLSGTAVRRDHLDTGIPLPSWYMRPEITRVLRYAFPPRSAQGVCLWFTGLSGSGKSTTAEILTTMLSSHGRRVTLLDGDIVRTHLSAGLSFDKEGRDANIRRIGFVAAEIVRHGGIAVCAAISPYRETRNEVRKMVGQNFFEIYVSTPIDVCEQRDPKGLYEKARRGEIKGFTGIDDIYEDPLTPDIMLDTVAHSAATNARVIIDKLLELGFLENGSTKDLDDGG